MGNCRVISTLSLPLFAVQRCGADRWLVRAPDSDPYGPAVRLVAMVDDAAYAEAGSKEVRCHEIMARWSKPRNMA